MKKVMKIIQNNLMPSLIIAFSLAIIIISLCYYFTNKIGDSGKINDAYNKSVPSKTMKGYTLDLRIYGNYNNKKVSSVVRVINYKNNNFLIKYFDLTNNENEKVFLINNNKTYKEDNGKFKSTKEEILYKNTSVYLSGLKNVIKIKSKQNKLVDKDNYTVYNVVFNKNICKDLVYNTNIEKYTTNKNINGEIWIDQAGYVYKIKYDLGNTKNKLEINAIYFGYNSSFKTNTK